MLVAIYILLIAILIVVCAIASRVSASPIAGWLAGAILIVSFVRVLTSA